MHPSNEKNTSVITDIGIYYYKVMSLGLKNARATDQRLVNRIFFDLIIKTIDCMLVKSLQAIVYFEHLEIAFKVFFF